MTRNLSFFLCSFIIFLFAAGFVFSAENRHALVIGNENYRDQNIASLTNPVNDATDVAAALGKIGYNVTLKTNIGLKEMMSSIRDFAVALKRAPENEGFFWFAGHGLSVRGVHYMLPVDVDAEDDSIIARGSYSVDDLMEELENARNRTNLIVIDACRNALLPGASGSRSLGTRGLAVLSRDDYRIMGNKIVYSTMAGRTALDGTPGSRNSPFAQAFISHINSPETFDDVFLDIANETMRLTRGDQEPYSMGAFAVKSYSLNPQAVQTVQTPQTVQPVQSAQAAARPTAPDIPVETNTANPSSADLPAHEVNYSARLSGMGWTKYSSNGETCGTTGQSRQMEAIRIRVNAPVSGGIRYNVYAAGVGWLGWVSNNEDAGTTGQSRLIEAIGIQLTGDLAEKYDVRYRVYATGIGWTNWSTNGENAGIIGQSRLIEAIQINMQEK